MTRADQIDAFLTASGLADTARTALAGDASARRYARVGGRILMDAPPETGEDIRPFLAIADRLAAQGVSVPRIDHSDTDAGLILMEDLGDELYSAVTRAAPSTEPMLYVAATETIVRMQRAACQDLPDYPAQMAGLACLAIDWYAPDSADARDDLHGMVASSIAALGPDRVFVHRDYHADNLLWLPERVDVARVGVLDFQDAMAGPLEYDLASLLHDARRVVGADTKAQALARWQAVTGRSKDQIALGFAVCSVQRGLRILGVFARLCIRDGKTHYPDFIPRTWELLLQDLSHPDLSDLAALVKRILPEPTPARLDAIRVRAGQGRP